MEAAKTAAINQEIKRILTEVLLKVAASLFLKSILYYVFFVGLLTLTFLNRLLMNFLMKLRQKF